MRGVINTTGVNIRADHVEEDIIIDDNHETSEEQINRLARYILNEFMYEIDGNGAVSVAFKIMEQYKRIIINKR